MENGNPFGGLTCTILDTIVCVYEGACVNQTSWERGVEGVGVKREVKKMILPLFFHYIISLKDTIHGDGKEK